MRRRFRRVALAVTAVVAVAIAGGVTYAVADIGSGVINGCYKSQNCGSGEASGGEGPADVPYFIWNGSTWVLATSPNFALNSLTCNLSWAQKGAGSAVSDWRSTAPGPNARARCPSRGCWRAEPKRLAQRPLAA
jgi:hypothetical protein